MRYASLAVSLIATASGCAAGDGPKSLDLPDPVALASQAGAMGHAFETPALQGFGAVALQLYFSNIFINSLTPLDIGKTYSWNSGAQAYVVSDSVGIPLGAVRVIVYRIDSTSGLPALPLAQVGAVDLFPTNPFFNPQIDTTGTMRYVVHDTGASPTVSADFTASSPNRICACGTVAGWVNDGVTRVDFSVPYTVDRRGFGRFTGTFTDSSQALHVLYDGGTPSLVDSGGYADAHLSLLGDSLTAEADFTFHSDGPPSIVFMVRVNGQQFATGTSDHGMSTFTGPGGRQLAANEQVAVAALSSLPVGIGLNVEYPMYTTFFCGWSC